MKKVTIMGIGRGRAFVQAMAGSEEIQLSAIVDLDREKLDQTAEAFNLKKDMLFTDLETACREQPADILVIATPTRLHTEHVMAGLDMGFHVLCEKPLATDRDSALRMRDTANKADRQLAVVQNMRYLPQFRKSRELVSSGMIGSLSHLAMTFHRWRPPRGLKHAVLFNHGVHHIDIIRSIVAEEPSWIQAVEWDPEWTASEPGSGRFVNLTAMMPGGCAVTYSASYAETGRQTPQTGELRICGENGSIEVGGEPDFDTRLWLHRNTRARGNDMEERIFVERCSWRDVDRTILEEFARAIDSGKPAETDISDNLHTLEWLFAAEESIRTGDRISM